jgi:chaperonin GroES
MADKPIYDENVLPACPIEPEGTKVVIIPDKVDERTSGGLYLPQQTKQMEQNAVTTGTLIRMGPEAEITFGTDGDKRPGEIGDRVIFARYGGVEVRWGKTSYRIVQDSDVVAFMTEEPPSKDDYNYRHI